MYATRRLYVNSWEHEDAEARYKVQIERGGKPVVGIQSNRISVVEELVMSWRKANHIHKWFVDNVQSGQDDCKEYEVDFDQIADLRTVCIKVTGASKLVDGMVYKGTVYDEEHPNGVTQRVPGKVIEDATMAKNLLPTCQGFFFGHNEYEENYLCDVVKTKDWAINMLAYKKVGVPGDIYYSSSW